jgi:hypothetical protein
MSFHKSHFEQTSFIILNSGFKVGLPPYDNLQKIGNKTKLKEFLDNLDREYNIEELMETENFTISKIGRTYYLDKE